MAERRPLILRDGRIEELPDGDSIIGASGSAFARVPGWRLNQRYNIPQYGGNPTSVGHGANQLLYTPFYAPRDCRLADIDIHVSVAVASSTAQLGIFSAHATEGWPETRLALTGALDTSTAGMKTGAIDLDVTAGWYWAAFMGTHSIEIYSQLAASAAVERFTTTDAAFKATTTWRQSRPGATWPTTNTFADLGNALSTATPRFTILVEATP